MNKVIATMFAALLFLIPMDGTAEQNFSIDSVQAYKIQAAKGAI